MDNWSELIRMHEATRHELLLCDEKIQLCKLISENALKKKENMIKISTIHLLREREIGWKSSANKKHFHTMYMLNKYFKKLFFDFEQNFFTFLQFKDKIDQINRSIESYSIDYNEGSSETDYDSYDSASD